MPHDNFVRAALRAATADAHARVDRLFSSLRLDRRDEYGRFLLAQARAHLPLEDALDRGAAPGLPIDWPARRRADRLRADLAELGLGEPTCDSVRPLSDPSAALGTLYVLEGSRLGGAVLRRSIDPAFPAGFLSPAPPVLWRNLLDILEKLISSPDEMQQAAQAALAAFGLFETSARALAREGEEWIVPPLT